MSRRNNKIATQAETADLISVLSEAASSSSSSAPIHATRGASAAFLAKEIVPDAPPVATRAKISFLFSNSVAVGSACQLQCVFIREWLTSKQSAWGSANRGLRYDVAGSLGSYAAVGGNVTTNDTASEYCVFSAPSIETILLWELRHSRYHGGVGLITTRRWCTVALPSSTACTCLARSTITV